MEHEYRQSVLRAQKRLGLIVAALTLPATFIFMISDFAIHSGALLQAHIAVRCFVGLATIALMVFMLFVQDEKRFDLAIFAWFLFGLAGALFVDYWRPAGSLSYVFVDLLFLFCTYTILPLPVVQKHIAGLFFTGACLSITFVSKKPLTSIESLSIVATFVLSNIVGSMVAFRYCINSRRDFFMAFQEKQLRQELEKTLMEIKVLKGLISICAWCKKIRVNEDHWDSVEAYISENTEATFTHSICPECTKKLHEPLA